MGIVGTDVGRKERHAIGTFPSAFIAGDKIPGWSLSSRKCAEFVYHDVVGRYIDRLGFGTVLGAYGNVSAAKFPHLWT